MPKLKAKKRKTVGRKTNQKRKEGEIPAIIYGDKTDNQPVLVDRINFRKTYKEAGENTLIDLKVGSKTTKVLIHDLQFHPVTDEILHIDFYHPSMKKKIESVVPLTFIGQSKAVEDQDGTLIKNRDEVKVEALAANLPKEIEVDISSLEEFHDKILAKDINVPKGVEILEEEDRVIALVTPPENIEEQLEKSIEEEAAEVKESIEEEAAEGEEEEEETAGEEDKETEEKEPQED